jgi:hypothetical protein
MLDQTFFPLLDDVDDDVVVKLEEHEAMGSLTRQRDVRGVVEFESDILRFVGLEGLGGSSGGKAGIIPGARCLVLM